MVDLIDSEEIYTFNRDYFHCIKKDKDKNIITEYTVDMRFTYYYPVLKGNQLFLNYSIIFFNPFTKTACSANHSSGINLDNLFNEKEYNEELYAKLLELNNTKNKFLSECRKTIIEVTNKLFNEEIMSMMYNFVNYLDKGVILDIEAYLSLRNHIFLFNGITADSYLKTYYNKYKFKEITDCNDLSILYTTITRPVINHYFDDIINPYLRYQNLSAYLDLYNNTIVFNENAENPDKKKLGIFKKLKGYIEKIKYSAEVFNNLVTIMENRYQFQQVDPKDVTWVIFNHYLLKIYHDKWLEYCVCGDIGDRSLEDYIQQCCDEDMLSIENKEAITIFIYYYCYLLNDPIEYPNIQIADRIICLVEKCAKENRLKAMENMLFSTNKVSTNQLIYTIDDIDLMDGTEFENLIAKLFKKMGYEVEVTKTSGDQGIDVLASKNGFKYGIQAKCYSSQVGNSAIQEAVAGKAFYSLNKVIVVTNNYFTKSAIKLAEANNVILWDRNILTNKLMYLNQ